MLRVLCIAGAGSALFVSCLVWPVPAYAGGLCPLDSDSLVEAVDAPYREKLRGLLGRSPVEVTVRTPAFASSHEVYGYLLDRLPLAATISRVLGLGSYVIEPSGNGFSVSDQHSLSGLIHEASVAADQRIYLGRGRYDGTWLRGVSGSVAVVLCYQSTTTETGTVAMTNTVHTVIRFDGPVIHSLARLLSLLFERRIKAELEKPIVTAQGVAEAITAWPQMVHIRISSYGGATEAEAAEFKRLFISD
jgi:hypothetical protein